MLLSKKCCCPSNETREKTVQVELEDDENGLFHCKLMRTKWNLIIENKIRIER
jgi:hypothetical protein